MSTLEGRIGLITGATAGIGEALAYALARLGAGVVINGRRAERLDEVVGKIAEDGGRATAVVGDAADSLTIDQMFSSSNQVFGSDPDIVVVNAGRGLNGSVLSSDESQWEEMIRTNLLGCARLMREAGNRMRQAAEKMGPLEKPFDLVVIGSNVGRHISPFSSMYGSTKFAVNSLAEAARRELGPRGVRVTLIEPGIVRSEFQESAGYDLESFGEFMESVGPVLVPEDVARVITFVVTQPANVHVNDVLLRPTRQEYP